MWGVNFAGFRSLKMMMGTSQSKCSSTPSSLDLPFEYLSISSAREHLEVTDEDTPLHVHLPVELQEELQKAQESPFEKWYVRDDVRPNRSCICDDVRGAGVCMAHSPTSPISIPSPNQRDTWQTFCTKRESLLEDAWQRKRDFYTKQEVAGFEEPANLRTLGRSSSDCSNHMKGMFQQTRYELLERSLSDCGKPKKDALATPNVGLTRTHTRSLTDDDFEELKGCLDLGFRFDQSSIPDLCDTLPALEVVSAINQNFQESLMASPVQNSVPSSSPSWRIINSGDDPEEVREKLRHWAQAVACSARLCY